MIYLIRSSFSKNLRKKCPDISEKQQKHRKIRKSENPKIENRKIENRKSNIGQKKSFGAGETERALQRT